MDIINQTLSQPLFVVEAILEALSKSYLKSAEDFETNYTILDKNYSAFIEESVNVTEEDLSFYGEEEQDLIEFAREVYYLKNPIKINKIDQNKALTLRNADDIAKFEKLLDKLINIDELDHNVFLKIFPKCPIEYFDKIDDLRETSKKASRDSEAFTRCLVKAKQISMSYSNG